MPWLCRYQIHCSWSLPPVERGSVVKELSLKMNLRLPEIFPSFQAMGRYGSHEYWAHPGNCIPLQKGDPDGSSGMSQIHRTSFTTETQTPMHVF